MPDKSLITHLENLVFSRRKTVIFLFLVVTVFMLYSAFRLRVDAGFSKLLPLEHEYMQTFIKHREEFGGANRILVALMAKDGYIFTPGFFETLKKVTDEVFFINGVDRTRVRSLFTPNVRFTEVVEDGIAGGNVIPDDFQPTPEYFATVRENIIKAGILGRLVANDFSGALVSAQLLEIDPNTGEKLDYVKVANQLEEKIRQKYEKENPGIDIHIIGFAKIIGDITAGAKRVILFFAIAFLVTAVMVVFYAQSMKVAVVPIACSLIAVIWQLGILPLLGFGIDPMSILVPFLIFAIGVSHGVQMISAVRVEIFWGRDCESACRASFRRLLIPGCIALLSDTIGFITILLIEVEIIQEMAITASIGVAVIILTNLILLPVLVSYLGLDKSYQERLENRARYLFPVWTMLVTVTRPKRAAAVIGISIVLLGVGLWKGLDVRIGDQHRGVPELHSDSRYNIDTRVIADNFSIGVDVLSVIVETIPEGCINYSVMKTIDLFEWHMLNTPGVQSVIALPGIARRINAGWNEGNMKWRVLPRNQSVLTQAVSYVPTSSGLLNSDCSVMPVLVFTTDHKAETIRQIVSRVRQFRDEHNTDKVSFRLATGNVGVMAATNEEVEAAQFPILVYVFSAIILLCLVTFRSIAGTLCIVMPLALVSLLAYALMSVLEIGLKVNTLPVVALGVGIGVDYGIYIYSRWSDFLSQGKPMEEAYLYTLATTGFGVLFTGITLAVGVFTWLFSPLKFQADMGILLMFMFLVNMLGAIFLLPALATFLLKPEKSAA
ncbi:MAG TPA: MMPL family transporter [Gammaproteobacteria bacterium]|nr:MMPL family transporter [Gammaproteobacteria bacterium]